MDSLHASLHAKFLVSQFSWEFPKETETLRPEKNLVTNYCGRREPDARQVPCQWLPVDLLSGKSLMFHPSRICSSPNRHMNSWLTLTFRHPSTTSPLLISCLWMDRILWPVQIKPGPCFFTNGINYILRLQWIRRD